MKIRFKLLSAILLITMLFTGCFGNKNENGDSAKGVRIARTGNSLFIMAASKTAGAEIVIDEAIDASNIKFENGNLGIVKTTKNETIISVIKPNGEIADNELMFSVYNTPEKLSIKADKVVSSQEADEAYEKEAKNIAKRAAGDVLVGDFNKDGIIDVADFTLFAVGYAATYNASYDIAPAAKASSDSKWADIYSKSTADGNIDIFDFIIFGRNYGKTNPDVNVKSITLSGATTVKEGKTIAITATVTYTNGTTSTADVLTWTTSDAAKATVSNGTVTGVAAGTTVITAEKDGIKGTSTITVEKVSTGLVMYLKKPANWTGANAYVWTGTGTTAKTLSAAWPGTAMTPVSGRDGWFSITLEGATAPVSLVFNGNGTDAQKTTDLTCTTQEAWYDAAWVTNPWQPQGPTVTLAGAGTYAAGTYEVTVNATGDGAVIKYTKDGTDPKTNGITIANGGKVSVTLAKDTTVTVKVYAENSIGVATAEAVLKYGEVLESKGVFSWDNVNMYFVITDRFYNGDTTNDQSYGRKKDYGSPKLNTGTFHGGDIKGLTQKLDYLNDLGINAIWLTAAYEQTHGFCGGGSGDFPHYAYHGYYPLDFTMMDKNMGTVEEFRTFVNEAHKRGIRVVMDIVMNHVGYNTALDAIQYNFGLSGTFTEADAINWTPTDGDWHKYHDKFFDYKNTEAWSKWWSSGWVRSGVAGYTAGGSDDVTKNLDFLPDIKTETTSNQGLAPILKTKWSKETSGYDNWIIPAAKNLRTDLQVAPADYITKWLSAWVEEFGIDGFRIDTVKHVEAYRWANLKEASQIALTKWRANNPTAPGANWKDKFWTVGEIYPHGANYSSTYHGTGKMDSVINFNFPKTGDLNTIGSAWKGYADSINNAEWNALHYINSHDAKKDYGWHKTTINHGTTLLLSPGGVQVYYGDENSRALGPDVSDTNQNTRSDYQWGSNPAQLAHWQKVGQFRRNHVSVGAGTQVDLGSNTYGRVYNKNGVQDSVVINVGGSGSVAVNVSGIFADGTAVRNAYDGATGTVAGGKVTFTASNGVILIEKQ
jgi:glycosidase